MRARMVCAYPILPAGLRQLMLRHDFKDKSPHALDFENPLPQGYKYRPNPDLLNSALVVFNTGKFFYPNSLSIKNEIP
jgi:hypothetical protein